MAWWLRWSQTRVPRLWTRQGLQLPRRRGRKRRLGMHVRVPGAPVPNSVWTYDFVHDRLADIRSDQGAEFTAGVVMPWLRDECLSREWLNGTMLTANLTA